MDIEKIELSVDEASAAGAAEVKFNAPVPFYLDNFLNFPAGTEIPLGSYDRQRGVWVASDNGRVIKILSITAGAANLATSAGSIVRPTSSPPLPARETTGTTATTSRQYRRR